MSLDELSRLCRENECPIGLSADNFLDAFGNYIEDMDARARCWAFAREHGRKAEMIAGECVLTRVAM